MIDSWLQPQGTPEVNSPAFTVIAGADVTYAASDQAVTINCSVVGLFHHGQEVTPELLHRFQHIEAMVLLWPYLRAAVGEIGHMLDLGLPPLPTLDVLALLDAGTDGQGSSGAVGKSPGRKRRSRAAGR